MALEWLKTILGEHYTESIDTQVARQLSKDYAARADFDAKAEELKQAKAQLQTLEGQLDSLKAEGGSMADKITALQEQNKQDKAKYAAEVAALRLDTAVDKALTAAGARNHIAVKALLADFLKDAKAGEDGTVRGLTAQLEALAKAEDSAFMFKSPEPPVFKGLKPGETGAALPAGGVNPFEDATFDLEAQARLYKQNPETAKALARQAGVKFI